MVTVPINSDLIHPDTLCEQLNGSYSYGTVDISEAQTRHWIKHLNICTYKHLILSTCFEVLVSVHNYLLLYRIVTMLIFKCFMNKNTIKYF